MNTSSRPTTDGKQRRDLQGLRTLAVGLVILYHLFPTVLPGGFVGVDVFFVISGYLIVGSLVREAVRTRRINLAAFYARRIRRLLPAATAVLLTTMGATVVFLPQSRWQDVARDVVASALQVQNWNQALGSVSYEAAGSLVSPVQHYWSLAVEEQFYLVIPLLLVTAVVAARWVKRDIRTTCLALLSVIVVGSLMHSVVFSATNHDIAYFATTTRMWELGLGGLAALILPYLRPLPVAQTLAGWAGLAMVLTAAATYSTSLDFPGIVAVLPVVGTILIVAAGTGVAVGNGPATPHRWGISAVFSTRPATYVGDISYSLYLWHWPVVVFYVVLRGHEPGLLGAGGIVVLSLLLAAASYRWIEQPFRAVTHARTSGARHIRSVPRYRRAYGIAGLMVALSCTAAAVPWSLVEQKTAELNRAVNTVDYPGALAFDPKDPAQVRTGLPLLPDPAVATHDLPLTGKDGCGDYNLSTMAGVKCVYGSRHGDKTIAVVGDSHASQYVDPLSAIALAHGTKLQAMVRNGCPFAAVGPRTAPNVTWTACAAQNVAERDRLLALRPDLVVVAGMTPTGYRKALNWSWASEADLVDGYVQLIKPLRDAGIPVSVIVDNPYPPTSIPDCVQKHGPNAEQCRVSAVEYRHTSDPLRAVAVRLPGVRVVDLGRYLCRETTCPAVIGNVLVYRDNHMTATFARTLAIPLQAALGL